MAIVHEALVCEGYWCMGQAGLVLLLFVVAVCCFFVFVFFYLHNLFSFSTYSSLSFYDSFSEYIYIYKIFENNIQRIRLEELIYKNCKV